MGEGTIYPLMPACRPMACSRTTWSIRLPARRAAITGSRGPAVRACSRARDLAGVLPLHRPRIEDNEVTRAEFLNRLEQGFQRCRRRNARGSCADYDSYFSDGGSAGRDATEFAASSASPATLAAELRLRARAVLVANRQPAACIAADFLGAAVPCRAAQRCLAASRPGRAAHHGDDRRSACARSHTEFSRSSSNRSMRRSAGSPRRWRVHLPGFRPARACSRFRRERLCARPCIRPPATTQPAHRARFHRGLHMNKPTKLLAKL